MKHAHAQMTERENGKAEHTVAGNHPIEQHPTISTNTSKAYVHTEAEETSTNLDSKNVMAHAPTQEPTGKSAANCAPMEQRQAKQVSKQEKERQKRTGKG